MLPAVKRAALYSVTAFAIAVTPAAPALAWGQSEHVVLKGVVGTLLVQVVSVILMFTSSRGQGLTDHVLGTVAINRPR